MITCGHGRFIASQRWLARARPCNPRYCPRMPAPTAGRYAATTGTRSRASSHIMGPHPAAQGGATNTLSLHGKVKKPRPPIA